MLKTNPTGGTPTSLAQYWSEINPFRYRGYYYDAETGLYYVSSRYYDPEIGRWISPEPNVYNGEFDEGAGLIGYNVYAYCANNPVNYYDPTGEFVISTLLICVAAGAIIGGTIGGIAGNAYANSKGYTGWDKTKSILTGIGIGGLAGGALGYFAAPAVVSATGVGNAVNQYANYRIEKKNQNQSKNSTNSSTKINSGNQRVPTSSNGKMASECDSFAEYVDCKSIAVSSATAMVFAPLSIAANGLVNSAFIGVDTTGVTGFAAQFIANFAMGGNISILQSIIDLF